MFSKSCEYGLQAILYIALHARADRKVGLKEIADNQDIPAHFLSKILQILVKYKLLVSVKGPNGGFGLYRKAEEITLLEVVSAIDGLDIFDRCGIGLKQCDDAHPCPIHNKFKFLRESIRNTLMKETLADLIFTVEEGKSYVTLKNLISE
jgi:Rrf2 family transcriptional regulator, iron-sulfur cluster assembly transcription factor